MFLSEIESKSYVYKNKVAFLCNLQRISHFFMVNFPYLVMYLRQIQALGSQIVSKQIPANIVRVYAGNSFPAKRLNPNTLSSKHKD